MKIHNEYQNLKLGSELAQKLEEIRKSYNFNVDNYIEDKCKLLNEYMSKCNLSGCVVAISGGIDSSIVLALVNKASKMENSPIKKIVPMCLPLTGSIGVTGQDEATIRATELCTVLGLKPVVADLTQINNSFRDLLEPKLNIEADAWGIGQLGPYIRTPALCYVNTLLNCTGIHSITVGTTNRSEFGYIGYIGKFSDEAVDVQLISDIYKSQVYEVAKRLNVPQSILDVAPTGDMFDGRVDEQVFGASYDFVELYYEYKNMEDGKKNEFLDSLSIKAKEEFSNSASNLETMHKYNLHKYISKSPAVHLDLFDASVKGGLGNYFKITQDFLNNR